jgi:hypothetical protein
MLQVSILREQCHALERQRVSLLDQCASLNRKAADAEAEMQVTAFGVCLAGFSFYRVTFCAGGASFT